LPGPQGTLYGVNSDGGVVNVISNDPVIGKYTGGASVNIGNYTLFREEAEANVPLGTVLALRVAGAAINRTSYITPAQEDAVGQSFRTKLLYKPNDQLSALGGFEFYHIGGLGTGGSVQYYQNGDINNLKNPWGTGAYVDSGPGPQNSHESEYGEKYWLNLSYQFGNNVVLNILPAYTHDRDRDQLCGPNGPPGTVGGVGTCNINRDPTLLEQVSSEERFTSAPGSAIIWDFGAYHWNYREKSSGGGPDGSYVGQQSNAGFAELTFPITSTLQLIGGVRESFDHKTSWESYDGLTNVPYGANFSHFDYRVGLTYDLTPSSTEYFTVSTGYRPGGINAPVTATSLPTLFKTEEVTSFELGSKNRFLDNTLQLNGDVFYYDQHNYQLLDFYTPYIYGAESANYVGTNQCATSPGVNAPTACSAPTLNLNAYVFGAEFQARYNLTADDQFNASGSYLDAKFSNNQSGPCVLTAAGAPAGGCYAGGNYPTVSSGLPSSVFYENLAGLTQPHAPTFSGNFSYQHTIELASGASLSAAAQFFVSTGYYVHPIESAYSYQPSYWTQGLNTTYTAASGAWSVNAYVRNLSNYAVKTALNPQEISEPRTYGVVGSWHF